MSDHGSCGIRVSEVKLRLLKKRERGLLGWASCVINESFLLNDIAVRQSREGKFILSFPARRKQDRTFYHYHPISREATQILTEAIIKEIRAVKGTSDQTQGIETDE